MKKDSTDKKKLLETIWTEVKKLNWNEINSNSKKKFSLVVVGDEIFLNFMRTELLITHGTIRIIDGLRAKFEVKQNIDVTLLKNVLTMIETKDLDAKRNLIKSADICITKEDNRDTVQELNSHTYCYCNDINSLIGLIIENHESILPALSYCFPMFRIYAAQKAIQKVALQNMAWVTATGAPNLIPGPHQTVAAVVEGISDFVVLTANETRLMLEIIGLSGNIVSPFKCFVEIGFLLGLATTAKWVAIQIVGKVPAGAGLVAKCAVAYTFTQAVGQAILVYQLTGKKIGIREFKVGFTNIYNESHEFVKQFVDDHLKRKQK